MLRINTRLEDNVCNVEEYIQKVAECMKRKSINETELLVNDFNEHIKEVVKYLEFINEIRVILSWMAERI